MKISTEFRRFRKRKKISQAQFALALGISKRAVVYIELGQRQPYYCTVDKFRALEERHRRSRGTRKTNAAPA